MTLIELYRVLPDDESLKITQGNDFELFVSAGNIPAYLLDTSIRKIILSEDSISPFIQIELCE